MKTFSIYGEEQARIGPYDARAIMGTSNAAYFERQEWYADRSTDRPRINLDDERPDITGLYDSVLATMWCSDFERYLCKLEEEKNRGQQKTAAAGCQ